MPNVFATKNGNWSDTTVWNTSALPTTIDDVFANNFTVTIDINTRVLSIRTTTASPAVAGGSFTINNNISLSANILAGSNSGTNTACLNFLSASPSTCTIFGNVSSSLTTIDRRGFNNNSSGTVWIFGNVKGGSQSGCVGVSNSSSGTVNIVGTVEAFSGVTSFGTLNASTGTINLTGTAFGGTLGGGTQPDGIRNNSTGTVNVSGICQGGPNNNGYGVRNESRGNVNVIGQVLGGVGGEAYGIGNNSTGTVRVTGTVVGGPTTSCNGIRSTSFGSVFVNGNVIGGTGTNAHGILNNSNGFVSIIGSVIGGVGSTAYGAFNNATGFMQVQGTAIGNGWGLSSSGIGGAAPGVFGSQTGTTIVQGLCCGPRGQWPTAGNVFIQPQQNSTMTFETSAFQDVTLFTSFSANITPPASSVRLGTRYNLNDYTGTCAMPSVSSVLEGVAIDNSIGVAALQPQTVWSVQTSAIDTNLLGGRLKESATVQSFGQLLTAFNM